MTTQEFDTESSPAKRKRDAPIPEFEGGWNADSLQVETVPSRKKKARFHLTYIEDETSEIAASSASSIFDTNTATVTVADTESPLTAASSTGSKSKPRPKKYQCTFPACNKAFDRPIRLQTHINSHTGQRPHQCPREGCDKSFYKPEHLNRHLKEKHGDSTFVCDFEVHNEDTGVMGPCGRAFESANKLKRHIAVHEDKRDTTCDWEGCGKVFRKQETLQRHIKKDHLNEDSFMCKRETAEGGTCGQSFPTPGQLKGHVAKEHNEPKYVCDICTNQLSTLPEATAPELDDLDPAFLPTSEDLPGTPEDVSSNILRNLSLEDMPYEAIQNCDGRVTFPSYHDLQRHNKVFHPPQCPQCGKKCKSNKDLTAHTDIEHPPVDGPTSIRSDKQYVCPYADCPRSVPSNGFHKKGNMDVHIKSVHVKAKDFVCGVYDLTGNQKVEGWNGKGCGLACVNKQSLIGHIRTQHLGIPAAINVRTGLREKDKTRKTRTKTPTELAEDCDDAMMLDQPARAPALSQALSMLTGAGYELRPHACLLQSGPHYCQMRFTNTYELGTHMELTHGWNVDDINDALAYESHRGNDVCKDTSDDDIKRKLETFMEQSHNNVGMSMIDPELECLSP